MMTTREQKELNIQDAKHFALFVMRRIYLKTTSASLALVACFSCRTGDHMCCISVSFPKERLDFESRKSGFGSNLSNPLLRWIRRIQNPISDFPKRTKIHFRIYNLDLDSTKGTHPKKFSGINADQDFSVHWHLSNSPVTFHGQTKYGQRGISTQ